MPTISQEEMNQHRRRWEREELERKKAEKKFNGLDPKTNALTFKDGSPRSPGIDPTTKEYSTAQMMFDEMYGGDTTQPLFD